MAVIAEDERDGSVQHEDAGVKAVSVRLTMYVGFEFAFADLVALAEKVGLEFGFVLGEYPTCRGYF